MRSSEELNHLFYMDEHISCLSYQRVPTSGFKHAILDAGTELKSEMMPCHNLLMIIKGTITIECDNYPCTTIGDDEMILIPRSVSFTGSVLSRTEIVVFGFEIPHSNCDKLRLESYSAICKNIKYNFTPSVIKEPIKMFLDLLIYYLSSGMSCIHMQESKHLELFLCLRCFYSKEEVAYLFHPIIGNAIDFRSIILLNCDKVKSINELESLTNMGRTQFFNHFKQEFGISPKQWMLKHKITKIRYAAARPNTSIKELMMEFGFENPSQFTQFCRVHFKHTPTELMNILKSDIQ